VKFYMRMCKMFKAFADKTSLEIECAIMRIKFNKHGAIICNYSFF
jgi:hypothetical protein